MGKLVLSFHHVCPPVGTQLLRLGNSALIAELSCLCTLYSSETGSCYVPVLTWKSPSSPTLASEGLGLYTALCQQDFPSVSMVLTVLTWGFLPLAC